MPTHHPAPPFRPREATIELEIDVDPDEATQQEIARRAAPAARTPDPQTLALRHAWDRARIARREGRIEDAIAELKRALHATRDAAACRAIFGELADIYTSQGERGEAQYYARRAGRGIAGGPRHPSATTVTSAAGRPRVRSLPPPPPPR